MTFLFQVFRHVLGFPIRACVFQTGGDLLIQIGGGCREHIGSVSTVCWTAGEMRPETILFPSHRDDVVGDRFASAVARATGGNVTVLCGIHYDTPGAEGIRQILSCTEELLAELLERLSPPGEAGQFI